jgi:hypothetical protein
MPEPDIPPATTSDEESTASADSGEHNPEAFAISPAIGPLPAIYVPHSPSEPSATGVLWHAEPRWHGGHVAAPPATYRITTQRAGLTSLRPPLPRPPWRWRTCRKELCPRYQPT